MVLRNVAKTFSLEEQRQEINEIAVDLDAVNTTLANWNAAQWDTAYSWGDHALAGYATNIALNTAVANSANWDTAYGWGDHGSAGYWVEDSVKITNWDTAYGWGDHGAAGYLVATSASYNNANWDTAYGWGDHGAVGYLTSYTETDPVFGASAASGIAAADITNWDTAYSWGDHGTAGYAASGDILTPGGTFAGAGTALDPAIGSIQFKNTGNTFGGDSTFLYNNTNNRLTLGTTTFDVGGTPSGTVAAFSVSTTEGSAKWATQIRSDNTAGNGLFLRAGNDSSYYTAYFTGYDENNVHFVVRGDGNVGIGNSNPPANLTVNSTASSTYEQIEFVRHVRSSSIIGFNGSNNGATKNVNVFLPIQSLKGVVVEYNISTNYYNNGNNQHDDYDVWNLKYEGTSVRIISQETALRIQNGGATTSVSAKTHTVNSNAGSGFDATFTINGEYDGYLVVTMKGSGVVGAPQITIT